MRRFAHLDSIRGFALMLGLGLALATAACSTAASPREHAICCPCEAPGYETGCPKPIDCGCAERGGGGGFPGLPFGLENEGTAPLPGRAVAPAQPIAPDAPIGAVGVEWNDAPAPTHGNAAAAGANPWNPQSLDARTRVPATSTASRFAPTPPTAPSAVTAGIPRIGTESALAPSTPRAAPTTPILPTSRAGVIPRTEHRPPTTPAEVYRYHYGANGQSLEAVPHTRHARPAGR